MTKEMILDIETSGLDSIFNRITCISVLWTDEEKENIVSFYGESEKLLLQQFWIAIKSADVLIGFNSDSFDLPFIIKRSLINNVSISDNFKNIKSFDLRRIVNSFFRSYSKYSKVSLRDWADVLLIDTKTEDGKAMVEYYNQKKWDKIKAHCEEDCMIIQKLYERIKSCNLV